MKRGRGAENFDGLTKLAIWIAAVGLVVILAGMIRESRLANRESADAAGPVSARARLVDSARDSRLVTRDSIVLSTARSSSGLAEPGERPGSPPTRGLALLFRAIAAVESAGIDGARGDRGRSLGRYQIGRAYWQDACEFGGVGWDYSRHVRSPPHCRQIMQWYWARHGADTDERRARMHNGGPDGHVEPETLGYWGKVRERMDGNRNAEEGTQRR